VVALTGQSLSISGGTIALLKRAAPEGESRYGQRDHETSPRTPCSIVRRELRCPVPQGAGHRPWRGRLRSWPSTTGQQETDYFGNACPGATMTGSLHCTRFNGLSGAID